MSVRPTTLDELDADNSDFSDDDQDMLAVLTDQYHTKSNDVEHGVSLLGLSTQSEFHSNAGYKSGILLDDDKKKKKKTGNDVNNPKMLSSGELSADSSDIDSDSDSDSDSDDFDTELHAKEESERHPENSMTDKKKLNFTEMNVNDIRQRSANMFGQNYPKTSSIGRYFSDINSPFRAMFAPSEMRQLALVAHNHMKPAMKSFIEAHSEVLKKFRITGTNTTMTMCKTIWGEGDDTINYGATCCSGPLGGDAQIASLICMEDIGGIIFFIDPLSAHPHQADIDSLVRLANVGNIVLCPNPSTACGMMWMLRQALTTGNSAMITSFFETLESPSVPEYKANQKRALQSAVNSGTGTANAAPAAVPQQAPKPKQKVEARSVSELSLSESFSDDESEDSNSLELLGLETGKIDINKTNDGNKEDDNSDPPPQMVKRQTSFQTNRKRLGGFREYMENNLEKNRNKNTTYKSSFL